jgi:AraC-like DNA-binding protein
MTTSPTVSASSTLALVHHLLSRGHATESMIQAKLGFPSSELEDPDCRVPVSDHNALWRLAITLTEDPALGLRLGEIVDPDRMGLMSHIVFNSDTVGHALDEYLRLHRLVNEAVHLYKVREGDRIQVIWHVPDEELYCIPDMDRTLSAAVTRARHFIHPRLALEQLSLGHEDPGYRAHYERIFQCPLTFGAGETSLCFPAEYLEAPLPHRNPYVHSALTTHVNRLLKQLRPRKTVAERVRRIISRQLPRTPDVDRVASALNMSRQTLYRKLKKEDESFQNLAENVRQERALRYVVEGEYGLSEVAFLLGFSELSAFSRAFKRWTGETPGHYRARHR